MDARTIRITQTDLHNLREAIREAENTGYRSSSYIQQLKAELERAEVVPSQQIPADVITMNSRVVLLDLEDGSPLELTLVYPQDAGNEGAVSVLAPIGTAMLGYRVGDEFEWETPGGKSRLKVDKILFQPEAEGVFDSRRTPCASLFWV